MATPSRLGALGALAGGVVLGFVLGGVGPRTALTERDAEIARLQDELVEVRARAARRSPLSVMGLDRVGASTPEAPPPPLPSDLDAPPMPDEPVDADPFVVEGDPGAEPGPVGTGMGAEFDAAVEAQRLRREQTRAALIEQADLKADEVEALDQAVARMNERLGAMGEDLLDLAMSGAEPDSAELLGMTHEVTGVLYEAQLEVDEIIGDDAVESVDPAAREIWNYVDLETFRDTIEAAEDAGWEQ